MLLGVYIGWWPSWERGDGGFALPDAAAAPLVDGAVVTAVEDGRLNRVRHSRFFPADAIRWELETGGTGLADVVAIKLFELGRHRTRLEDRNGGDRQRSPRR
jgi:carbamoyltransferase